MYKLHIKIQKTRAMKKEGKKATSHGIAAVGRPPER
jgi:hypothetical protein